MLYEVITLEQNGHIVEPIDPKVKLVEEINRLKKEKNAVILSHFYVDGELQDIADYVGDSLQLAQEAAKTEADMIVFVVITSYSIHYTKLYETSPQQVRHNGTTKTSQRNYLYMTAMEMETSQTKNSASTTTGATKTARNTAGVKTSTTNRL